MDPLTLIILGTVVALLAGGVFFGLIFLAILSYVVKNVYPPTRKVSLWASRLENLLPLLLLAVILLVLIIVLAVLALKLPAIAALLLLLLVFILIVCLIIVDTFLLLGLLVYIVRLVGWLYGRWKGLLGGLVPQVMKLKIKHEGKGKGPGKGKDFTTHFADLRKKLSGEAEDIRRNISKGGK